MFDKTKLQLTKTARLLIGFCIVVFGTWFIASQFASASQKGQDAVKQIEVKQIESALALYNLRRDAQPRNLAKPDWCEIGRRYGDRICLYELTRDGYLTTLPISPDEHPYYYRNDQSNAYIAVVIDHTLDTIKRNTCMVNGVEMWCVTVGRL